MKSSHIPPEPRPVELRSSVDYHLQQAWLQEQWSAAASIARQRHKTSKDNYYLAVEIAAKSQLDDATTQVNAELAVKKLLDDDKAVASVDALDLYEFACSDSSQVYSATIGALRVRLVKATPLDRVAALRCLDACIWHSDWVNAQQIAVSLDRNFPKERAFLYYNILATYIVSASNEYLPEDKRKLFVHLAKAQADKAFRLRAAISAGQGEQPRAIRTAQEHLLCLSVRLEYATSEDNLKFLESPTSSPVTFLQDGFIESFRRAMVFLAKYQAWDALLKIGTDILQVTIARCQKEALVIEKRSTAKSRQLAKETNAEAKDSSQAELEMRIEKQQAVHEAREDRTAMEQNCITASHNVDLWKSMVQAAMAQPNSHKSLKQVRQLIDKAVKALQRAEAGPKGVLEKNSEKVFLEILFARSSDKADGAAASAESSTRIRHLHNYVVRFCADKSCFDDVQMFIGELSQTDVFDFLRFVGNTSQQCNDKFKTLSLVGVRLGIRLLHASTGHSGRICSICQSEVKGVDCLSCIEAVAESALDSFASNMHDAPLLQRIQSEQEDPLSNLVMIGSVCLLKLGVGERGRKWDFDHVSPLDQFNLQLFLQAVMWLHFYAEKQAKNDAAALLLVKLYVMMGCVSHAKKAWNRFGVKNVILNSLASHFFDRQSTIAPGEFMGSARNTTARKIMNYYSAAARRTMPGQTNTALRKDNYSSLLNIIRMSQRQRTSCTLAMAVVEDRRGLRMRGGKPEKTVHDEPLLGPHSTGQELVDTTDYSYIPNFSGPESVSVAELINYGPLPSAARVQMGLLSERFMDLVCFVPSKDLKSPKPSQDLKMDFDSAAVISSSIEQKLGQLLNTVDDAVLTNPERKYFTAVHSLSVLVKTIAEHEKAASPIAERIRRSVTSLLDDFSEQSGQLFAVLGGSARESPSFYGVTTAHAMGVLHDTALAIKHTATFLAVAVEKLKAVDKAATSLKPELDKLAAAAGTRDADLKKQVKQLASKSGAWADEVEAWALRDDEQSAMCKRMADRLAEIVPKKERKEWAETVVQSWSELLKGWELVKFD
ncbi:N-acetyltransferase B complex non catalytic subunit-domain-containing protein [Xylariomycetidae sp. FL0641]|nr:N-acetyltransferase B complex non catalytic subunit-domain-containing protein [Xylariomycetidae sp. FL0641]